jgi:hypothetical protein
MKTVIEMAREAGIHVYPEFEEAFERFAELVRADERAACAMVCDNRGNKFWTESPFAAECHGLADTIRARGEASIRGQHDH